MPMIYVPDDLWQQLVALAQREHTGASRLALEALRVLVDPDVMTLQIEAALEKGAAFLELERQRVDREVRRQLGVEPDDPVTLPTKQRG